MNYYVIAGEASGDLHASNLMRELRQRDPAAIFRCWGGGLMQQQGGTIVTHYRDMAYMGFVEVLTHLPAIFRNIRRCKQDLMEHRPDVLILVDFPGFNLRIAAFAKEQGIPVFYYISPKIWAWNQKRALKIKRVVDRMFCILPFEVEFYRRFGMEVDYVGNPLADAIAAWEASHDKEATYNGGAANGRQDQFSLADQPPLTGKPPQVDQGPLADQLPLIALLPGSRKQEISRILPEMLQAARQFTGHQIVIAGAPAFSADFYRPFIASEGKGSEGGGSKNDRSRDAGDRRVTVVFGQTYDLLHRARAALVTSGTATLETALFNVPQVVLYKANALSVAIARRLVKIRFISLVNLIAGKEVVRELIQDECNPREIATELGRLLSEGHYRSQMLADYAELKEAVGGPGASARAAEKMIRYLSE